MTYLMLLCHPLTVVHVQQIRAFPHARACASSYSEGWSQRRPWIFGVTLGIRARLLAGFVAVALFTGVLGWYAVSTMANMNSGQQTTYGDIFGGTHLLAAWVDTSWEDRADLLDYLLTEDPGAAAFDRAEMARALGERRALPDPESL